MNYVVFFFSACAVMSEQQVEELLCTVRGVITEIAGKFVNEGGRGFRKLAYPIHKKTTGYYFLLEFTGEGSLVDILETQYLRDERVIRFRTFPPDKYAVEYSEKRRNKLAGKTIEKKEEE